MRCLLYVASFLASAAAASADPCPPKPICGRTDCYNEWINCFDEAEKPGVSMGVADYLSKNLAHEARSASLRRPAVNYPKEVTQRATVTNLTKSLDPWNIWYDIQTFSNFTNRYYQTTLGEEAYEWLYRQVSRIANGTKATVTHYYIVPSLQQSIIATIPGRSNKTVIVGAHLDSAAGNMSGYTYSWDKTPAPGADDNASGSMTILEAFRVLLTNETIASGKAPHTIEFHWYAANSEHLKGSAEIFQDYARANRNVIAMLNQDQTGYTSGFSDDEEPTFGIITDYTDKWLTKFVTLIIDEYTDTPGAWTVCGSECSDHVSATKAGYPSAYIAESPDLYPGYYRRTIHDTIDKLNATHMLEHSKLVVGFAVELAFANLG